MPRGAHLPEVNKPYRFVKGQSGNPGGRPKTKPITEAIVKELRKQAPGSKLTNLELGARKLVQLWLAGDVRAAKEVLDRVEGTAVESVEYSGPDGSAIEFTLNILKVGDGSSSRTG